MVSDGQSGGQIDQPSMSHVTSIANKCSLISVKTSSTFTSFRLLTIKAYHEKGLDVPIELQGYFNVKYTVCPRSVEFHWHKFNSLKKKKLNGSDWIWCVPNTSHILILYSSHSQATGGPSSPFFLKKNLFMFWSFTKLVILYKNKCAQRLTKMKICHINMHNF